MQKKNPHKIPATYDAAEAAHKMGMSTGTYEGMVVYLTVLRDKEGFGTHRLNRTWKKVTSLCKLFAETVVLSPEAAKQLDAVIGECLYPKMYHPDKLFTEPKNPVTQADVIRAAKEGHEAAFQFVTLVFLFALYRSEHYGSERLKRVHREARDISDSIARRYIKARDLETVLLEEAGIQIV